MKENTLGVFESESSGIKLIVTRISLTLQKTSRDYIRCRWSIKVVTPMFYERKGVLLTLLKYPTVWQPSESANVII